MTSENRKSHRVAVCAKCWHLADAHATDEDPHELGRCLGDGCVCAEYQDAAKTILDYEDKARVYRECAAAAFKAFSAHEPFSEALTEMGQKVLAVIEMRGTKKPSEWPCSCKREKTHDTVDLWDPDCPLHGAA